MVQDPICVGTGLCHVPVCPEQGVDIGQGGCVVVDDVNESRHGQILVFQGVVRLFADAVHAQVQGVFDAPGVQR